jgi:hypothetical protein
VSFAGPRDLRGEPRGGLAKLRTHFLSQRHLCLKSRYRIGKLTDSTLCPLRDALSAKTLGKQEVDFAIEGMGPLTVPK